MKRGRLTTPRWAQIALLLTAMAIALACNGLIGRGTPIAAPATPDVAPRTMTPPPTSPVATDTPGPPTLVASPSPAPVAADDEPADNALVEELVASLAATVPLASTESPDSGFAGVAVLPLGASGGGEQLFAGYSLGMRLSGPAHFVSLHAFGDGAWDELGRVEIEAMDTLFEGALAAQRQANLLWLELNGFIGAHGTCYYLLRWDETTLTQDLGNCHSSFASAGLDDLDGDGLPEVILNQTDDYIYCYACLVRRPAMQLMHWTGSGWVEIELRRSLSGAETPELAANDLAVALAEAGLWLDAGRAISGLPPEPSLIRWNQILIGTLVDAHQAAVVDSPLPLLNQVFLGDYEAAVAALRPHSPAALFTTAPAPFSRTPAEGYNSQTAVLIRDQMDLALPLQPERAAAHFLRGWATFILDPANPAGAIAAVEEANRLAPADTLYADSLAYLRS